MRARARACACACLARTYGHGLTDWKTSSHFSRSSKPTGPSCALRRLKCKQLWWNGRMLIANPLEIYECIQVPPRSDILLQISEQGEARPFGVRFLYWDAFYQSKVSTLLSWRTLSTPTIASESQPETLEAFCFSPVACPKARPSLPLPAACIVLHSRDLIDCCHLMLRR